MSESRNKIRNRLLWLCAIALYGGLAYFYFQNIESGVNAGWLIAVGLFFNPFFLFQLYLLWERRQEIKEVYYTAEASMGAIKAINKAKKEARGKKNGRRK